mmetsp:Transcript_78238/g.253000  ORF Transcript_78238/g.253000 Transcript_78238/m.253000 type:complete len:435 (-) Transcript_78238:438-1742(-)
MQPLDELPQRTRLRLGLARRLLCDCASLVLGPGTDLLGLGPGPGLQLGGLSPRLREQGPALLLGPGALGLVGAPTGLLQPALLLALPAELLRALLFCGLRLLQHGGGLFLHGDLGTLLGLCGCALLGGGLLLSSRLGGRSLIRLPLEHRLPLSFDAGHHLAGLHLCPALDDARLDRGPGLEGLDLGLDLCLQALRLLCRMARLDLSLCLDNLCLCHHIGPQLGLHLCELGHAALSVILQLGLNFCGLLCGQSLGEPSCLQLSFCQILCLQSNGLCLCLVPGLCGLLQGDLRVDFERTDLLLLVTFPAHLSSAPLLRLQRHFSLRGLRKFSFAGCSVDFLLQLCLLYLHFGGTMLLLCALHFQLLHESAQDLFALACGLASTLVVHVCRTCRDNWRHFYLLALCHGRLGLLVLSLTDRRHVIRLCPGLFQDLGLR